MENNPLGYLTVSMVASYDCPRKYYYQYVEGWKPVTPAASLVFGIVFHESIAGEFLSEQSAQDIFSSLWSNVGELKYPKLDTHESLRKTGLALLAEVQKTAVYSKVLAVEKAYTTELPDGTIFKGKIDMIYEEEGQEVVLDWKTASRAFSEIRTDLDDQLTAYSMLSGIRKVSHGVLLKRKTPEVKFLYSHRSAKDYSDLQEKIMKVAQDIKSGFFFRKPSLYCAFCDFLPLCRGQRAKARAELKRLPVEDRYGEIECAEALCAS